MSNIPKTKLKNISSTNLSTITDSFDNDVDLQIRSTHANSSNKNAENIITHLQNIQLVMKRILQDIYTCSSNMTDFLLYFQKCDKTNSVMTTIMIKKIYVIAELFYKSFINHLSIVNNEYGIGDKLIKPVGEECGKVTIIKYNGTKKVHGTHYIQNTINVATIDNISINCIIDKHGHNELITGCSTELIKDNRLIYELIAYNISIGNLSYIIDLSYKNNIENIPNIINQNLNILEDIEISLTTNIDYINKYIFAFRISGF